MGKHTVRIRRVGSVTFGVVLIIMGVLFLIHVIFPAFGYSQIYRFWPFILILLGLEVLVGSAQKTYEVTDDTGNTVEQSKVVYDVPAILLMIVLIGFAMGMAITDYVVQYHANF